MKLQSIRETAQRYGVDRSVSYAVGARLWQLMAGQVTALLIVFSMTTVEQGYYYAFLYLLAMQIFVELGLHVVLINVASHEWAGLQLSGGRVAGEPKSHARLSSLTITATRWYSVAAFLFAGIVSVTGWVYFNSTGLSDASAPAAVDTTMGVNWAAPWFTLVVLTALQLVILPKTSVLEGCDQLAVINRIRLVQNIVGSVVVWLIMLTGFGVWALCGSAGRAAGRRTLPCQKTLWRFF